MKLPGRQLCRIKSGEHCIWLSYLEQKFWKQLSLPITFKRLVMFWHLLPHSTVWGLTEVWRSNLGRLYDEVPLGKGFLLKDTQQRCLLCIHPAGNGWEHAGGWRKHWASLQKTGSIELYWSNPDCQQCQQTLAFAVCWIHLSFILCLCLTITKQFGFFNLALEPEQELTTALWSNFYLHSSWLD